MGGGGGWFQCGFRLGAAEAGPEEGAGPGAAVRPSWSFAATVAEGVRLRGAVRGLLPEDCRDALLSETHLLLRRGRAALEAWAVGAAPGLEGQPVWRRALRPEEAEPALPLVRGGYVFPRPPFFAPLPAGLRARELALGHEHALLLVAGGALFAWGGGRHGQLGHGDLQSLAEPRRVEALQGLPVGQVAAGGWHSACLSETGDLYVWGWNEAGQLALPAKGDAGSSAASGGGASELAVAELDEPEGTLVSIQAFPALLDLPHGAEVSKVSCGSRHTAAVTRAGDLYTWGWGKYGQLGHADTASSDQPRKVCFFMERGLCVVNVVCGPWTTYACATPNLPARRKSSSLRPEPSCLNTEDPPQEPQDSLKNAHDSPRHGAEARLNLAPNEHCQWSALR